MFSDGSIHTRSELMPRSPQIFAPRKRARFRNYGIGRTPGRRFVSFGQRANAPTAVSLCRPPMPNTLRDAFHRLHRNKVLTSLAIKMPGRCPVCPNWVADLTGASLAIHVPNQSAVHLQEGKRSAFQYLHGEKRQTLRKLYPSSCVRTKEARISPLPKLCL